LSPDENLTLRILALETSGRFGSVAAADDDKLLLEKELDQSKRSAASLAPALKELLAQVGWRPADVELTAVTVGPGSFTGLRIGVATAKAFAYAIGSDVIGVNTLDAIARRAPAGQTARLAAAIDAGRGQVFAAAFERDASNQWQAIGETTLESIDDWLAQLSPDIAATGPALLTLADRIPAGVPVVDQSLWLPTAAGVAEIARLRFQAGQRDDVWTLAPLYLRRSAAEETRHRK
jgi:tRNA threonylcarbamoyladenosine biosynthesis protein TsaB